MRPDSKNIKALKRNVFFSGLVSFFMDLSSEMVYPLVPLFLSSVLGVNKSVIGLIEGVAESTASIVGGFLWDKYGPQATFYFGAFTASVSAVLLIIIYGMDFKGR